MSRDMAADGDGIIRALIVDDSRTVRAHVRALLDAAGGFVLSEAEDGAEALRLLEETRPEALPDVILLDRNMPKVTGDACIRILKSDPVWRRIPVLFLTAQADKAEVVKGLSALGCDDYLPKPFDAGEMIARVGVLARMKKAEDRIRGLNADLAQALDLQRKTSESLKDALEVIESSIRYAARIQRAVLPEEELFSARVSEHFTLWQPRDMVGGDIYWYREWGDGLLVALADCTGHGVPGAFMTLISSGALDMALRHAPPGDPAGLIGRMHALVLKILSQNALAGHADDGLELGVCYIPPGASSLVFAGAHFPLFVVSPDGVEVVKGDRSGIGYKGVDPDAVFTNREVAIAPDRRYYLATDGVFDQIDGVRERPFGKKRFQELLMELAGTPLTGHGEVIYQRLSEYRGTQERLDDVSVIGFRFGGPHAGK